MTVRELIKKLLDEPLDADVILRVKNIPSEESDVIEADVGEIVRHSGHGRGYVAIEES